MCFVLLFFFFGYKSKADFFGFAQQLHFDLKVNLRADLQLGKRLNPTSKHHCPRFTSYMIRINAAYLIEYAPISW